MLTVVTQNSRLLRRSVPSGDRMAFGFGYPHCWRILVVRAALGTSPERKGTNRRLGFEIEAFNEILQVDLVFK